MSNEAVTPLKIDAIKCGGCGAIGIAVDSKRITSHKCNGQWTTVARGTFDAPAASRDEGLEEAAKYFEARHGVRFDPEEVAKQIRALQSRPAYDRDALKRLEREIDEENGNRIPESLPASAEPSEKPHLVHEAKVSLLNRAAKYNDPDNLEWEWDDAPKYERHAINAVLDLQVAETKLTDLRAAYTAMRDQSQKLLDWVECDVYELVKDAAKGMVTFDMGDANRLYDKIEAMRAALAQAEQVSHD